MPRKENSEQKNPKKPKTKPKQTNKQTKTSCWTKTQCTLGNSSHLIPHTCLLTELSKAWMKKQKARCKHVSWFLCHTELSSRFLLAASCRDSQLQEGSWHSAGRLSQIRFLWNTSLLPPLSDLVDAAAPTHAVFLSSRRFCPTTLPPRAHNSTKVTKRSSLFLVCILRTKCIQFHRCLYRFVMSSLFTTVPAFICRVWVLM